MNVAQVVAAITGLSGKCRRPPGVVREHGVVQHGADGCGVARAEDLGVGVHL